MVAAALLIIAFVGFSRVFSGGHYLTDVLAGYAVGIAWFGVAYTLIEIYFQKRRKQMSKKNKSIRVKLIANPGAGKAADAANNLKLVMGYLEKNGLKVDVALAKPKEEATPIARQAVKDGYKIVIAMGGDGTIEAVMRGMVDSKARLGIIPAGTENNIALSLGIPKDLEEACALIASDNTAQTGYGSGQNQERQEIFFLRDGHDRTLGCHLSRCEQGCQW